MRGKAALLLLLAFVLLCAHGLRWDTPTVDEFAHLPAGWYYWQTGSFALFPQNPPLVKLLSALRGVWVAPEETLELLAPYEEWQGLAGQVLMLGWSRGLIPGADPDLGRRTRRGEARDRVA